MNELIFRCARREDVGTIVVFQANCRSRAGILDMKAFAGVDSDPRQELIVVELDGIVVKCLQLTTILSLSHRRSKHARSEALRVDSRLRGSGESASA